MPPEDKTVTNDPAVPVNTKPSLKSRLKLMFWKLVCLVLVIALATTVSLWKPWQPNIKAGERIVVVSGTAVVKSEPDEFVFYPSYSFNSPDKQTALSDMTNKSDEIVTKLKSLGVASSKIKTDSSGYSNLSYPVPGGDNTYNMNITVTIDNKDLAQKVQDYLITTSPSGPVTPSASFSTVKQKQLEGQARDQAEQDARAKAEQSAKNLGFKVDKVKNVDDNGFNDIGGCGLSGRCPMIQALDSGSASQPKLSVQPGENELPYSVKVTYYIH